MSKHPFNLGSRLLMAAASFAVLAACGENKPAPAPEPPVAAAKPSDDPAWPVAAVSDATKLGFTAAGLAALDARLAQAVADQNYAGVVAVLAKGGEVAHFKAYGVQSGDPKTGAPMTQDSIFRIYSMTKPITGVALMQLYEKGLWQLDDPITKFIPEFENLQVLTWKDGKPVMKGGKPVLAKASRPATMRELMSHTAGFGYGLSGADPVNNAFRDQKVLVSKNLDEMIAKIKDIPLLYEPGTRWSYSVAVDIQGYIAQKLSGQKFGDYLQANIFTPLGMNDTSFIVADDKKTRFADIYTWKKDASALAVMPEPAALTRYDAASEMESGGGGLTSTAHDYLRFTQMLLNKGALAGKQILKPESIALMAENHIGELGVYSDGTAANPGRPGQKFGLDFAIYTDPAAGNNPYGKGAYYWSGAAGTIFWVDPVNDVTYVALIQSMGGARPEAMNLRDDSGKLIYAAMAPAAAAATPAEATKQIEPAH
ncbi:MAG: serine hydrolase domain-containing protein [Hyphomonadaceae bacterium]